LWRGTALIVAGAMTVGSLTVFLAYLSKFFKPVQDLAKMTNTIAQTAVGLERIQKILEADVVIPESPTPSAAEAARRDRLRPRRVRLRHRRAGADGRQLQRSRRAGDRLVGGTGSGKSTIVSLIPRFYDPTAGTIALDGRDLRDYKVHPLRDQIGYVLQETVLFRGTIRENIAYGRPDASEQEIVAAAKLANADEFIAACRTATTRTSASAATRCRAGSGRGSASRARSSATRRC
jgi:subfamily B ATP-binding cassette protein MsbA